MKYLQHFFPSLYQKMENKNNIGEEHYKQTCAEAEEWNISSEIFDNLKTSMRFRKFGENYNTFLNFKEMVTVSKTYCIEGEIKTVCYRRPLFVSSEHKDKEIAMSPKEFSRLVWINELNVEFSIQYSVSSALSRRKD